MRLVLASASPRRAELLRAAGFEFDVHPVDIDERPRPGEAPDVYVRRLAAEKAAVAAETLDARQLDGRAVLAADTAVVLDDEILGKPRDAADMREMLRRLSGRRHEVLTGLSLRSGVRETGTVERTAVFFAVLGTEEVDWYVKTGEGSDKAGGYAIQGLASRFVRRIEGSYSNVVGLPVSTVYELLRATVQLGDLP
jgi:septum formation protein